MSPSRRDDLLFWLGVALWVAVLVATWPRALSFGDEVGYVSEAKLLLSGHVRYVAHSPGVWNPSPHGLINKYPLLPSLLLAPFVALTPRAAFVVTIIAALLLVRTARSILESWGRSPLWALLVLAYPTTIILARTVMGDILQAAAVLGGWWALRRGRAAATVAWLAFLVAYKPTGAVLGLGVAAGEAISSFHALRARDPATWRRFGWAALGGGVGLAIVLALNHVSTGSFWFAYDHTMLGTPPFWYTYLRERTPAYLETLLLNPPLLILGALPYWRRRELGPLILSLGYIALMCTYFFIDTAPNWLETMVLTPRLVLPSIVFLLLGWGMWIEERLARRAAAGAQGPDAPPFVLPRWAAGALVAIPLLTAGAVSARHARFQRPSARILEVASLAADKMGDGALGLTESACKVGLLYRGHTSLYDPGTNRPAVVLCNEQSASHRAVESFSCALPGYGAIAATAGMVVLVRDDIK